jgi:nickel-dependent lactate racemase
VTPIRKGTATRLGLRHRPSVADFAAVIDQHIADAKAEWSAEVVSLFDAEVEAQRQVFDDHRRTLNVLAQRQRSRADVFAGGFKKAFRML